MTKAPRSAGRGQAALCSLAILLAVSGVGRKAALAASAQGRLDFAPADFEIRNPSDGRIIGHAHYSIERRGAVSLLRGENRYSDGQYDIEVDRLVTAGTSTMPGLAGFEHSFFNADGSPALVERAELDSGRASCVRYRGGQAETLAAVLDFPPDTYAGAGLLVPIEYQLRSNRDDSIRLYAFSCVPGPRVLAVEARPRGDARWAQYAGEVFRVDVRPKLGWWDLLLEPFIPRIKAWFDPSDRFSYVGGEIQRFYRGPWIELVRERNAPLSAARKTPSPKRAD